jgi:hypothetical protein
MGRRSGDAIGRAGAQQQTERINEDVPLAAGDLLARVVACGSIEAPLFAPPWQQDRVLRASLMLPPHSGALRIASFCVESGLWEVEQPSKENSDGRPQRERHFPKAETNQTPT